MTAHSGNHHGSHGQHPSDGGVLRFASLIADEVVEVSDLVHSSTHIFVRYLSDAFSLVFTVPVPEVLHNINVLHDFLCQTKDFEGLILGNEFSLDS